MRCYSDILSRAPLNPAGQCCSGVVCQNLFGTSFNRTSRSSWRKQKFLSSSGFRQYTQRSGISADMRGEHGIGTILFWPTHFVLWIYTIFEHSLLCHLITRSRHWHDSPPRCTICTLNMRAILTQLCRLMIMKHYVKSIVDVELNPLHQSPKRGHSAQMTQIYGAERRVKNTKIDDKSVNSIPVPERQTNPEVMMCPVRVLRSPSSTQQPSARIRAPRSISSALHSAFSPGSA
jgi:hypothetical protein